MLKFCNHKPIRKECPTHGHRWREFHNPELRKSLSIAAVFYCAEAGCGEFEVVYENADPRAYQEHEPDALYDLVKNTAIRMQIFLLKEKRRKDK